MHAKRIRSAEDVERLRQLRNETRSFMTGHTKLITKKQQADWWAATPRRAWLFGNDAFAHIKRERGRNWITLGISKKSRGQGLGTLIYWTLRPCWARIREDNLASIRAAEKAGYVIVPQFKSDGTLIEDGTVVMKG